MPVAAQPATDEAKPASAAVALEQASEGQTAAAEQQAMQQAELAGAVEEEQQQAGGSDQQSGDQSGGAGQQSEAAALAQLDPTEEQLLAEAGAAAAAANQDGMQQAAAAGDTAEMVGCVDGFVGSRPARLLWKAFVGGWLPAVSMQQQGGAGMEWCLLSTRLRLSRLRLLPCRAAERPWRSGPGRRSAGCVQAARCGGMRAGMQQCTHVLGVLATACRHIQYSAAGSLQASGLRTAASGLGMAIRLSCCAVISLNVPFACNLHTLACT